MADAAASAVGRPVGGGGGSRGHRAWRKLLVVAAAVVAGVLALAVALPLVVRGPVARWAVARATGPRCGAFAIGGGHLGWASVLDLAFGRPMPLVLEDVQITGADGRVVFAAARFEATLEIHPLPWRIALADAVMSRGRWRLALGPGAIGTADAFRTVPASGRAACLDPNAPRPRRKPSAGSGGAIAIRGLELQDVDVELDFPTWGLSLTRANAAGTLSAGGDGPPILFDARDVVAAAGTLRIGRSGDAWTARVPFDAVAIERVAVAPESPTDLQLAVTGARTGRARLAGHARFENIFPERAGGQPPARSPTPAQPTPAQPTPAPATPAMSGVDADVRWTNFAAALSALEAEWRPGGGWMTHLDGDLAIDVKGPFTSPAVALTADGGGNHLAAHLARGSADLTLALAGVDTRWLLDPALAPLLGGILHGQLNATARLAPTLAGMQAELVSADLRLDRRRAPSGPRHYELRVGRERRVPGAIDTLYASIGRVGLSDGTLKLETLRLDWIGLAARADALVAFPDQKDGRPAQSSIARSGAGAVDAATRPRSRVAAQGTLSVAALEDWIPGGAAAGPLRLSASLRGTLERVDFQVLFPPPATVDVFGQRFVLPTRLDARMVSDGGLTIAPLRLRRVGGGEAELGGQLGAGGRVSARVRVLDYPLAALPGLDHAGLPVKLGGTLGADLALSGALAQPTLEGRIDVRALALDRRPLGDAAVKLRLGAERGVADLILEPGLALHATVRRRPRLAIDGKLTLTDRALGPWLPPPLAGAPIAATGTATIAYTDGAPPTADGSFRLKGPGLDGVTLGGHARGGDARGHLSGQIDLAAWPALWSRYFQAATGIAAVDLAVVPTVGWPRISGTVRIARDFVLRTPRWPAPITLPAGGALDFDGAALSSPELSIDTPGLHGKVAGRVTLATLDPVRAGRSNLGPAKPAGMADLGLTLSAELDAARFPIRLPGHASLSGRLVVDAKVTGTLGGSIDDDDSGGPRIDGQARFEELVLHPPVGFPALRARGVIEAHGATLRTSGLAVDVVGVGAVDVGSPAAPAQAELASLSPLRLGRVDVPLSGQHLVVGGPTSALEIPDLDADVRLTGDARGELKLSGEVAVAGGSYDPSRGRGTKAVKPRATGPWYRILPPHLTLDLLLHGPRKAVRVTVPVLPDVNVDFQCHLVATSRGASLGGRLRGDGLYARAAVAIYDWLTPGDLRRCQIGTP
jgi:hypothetical protein